MSDTNSDYENSVITESSSQIESENTSVQAFTAPEPIKRSTWIQEEIVEVIPQGPPPAISDEEAFPALGGGAASAAVSPSLWGPSATVPSSVTSPAASAPKKVLSGVARSRNIQEAFNISSVVSLKVTKSEFTKIVNDLKKKYQITIDSTSSSVTHDRSFIVSGLPENVYKARKELVRQLTKPVSLTFTIPAKTRSVVIGAGGKNLKPIIESTGTRINIGRYEGSSEEEDTAELDVTIEGDIDGVAEAKQSILEIVEEETKYLTAKVVVPEGLAPFVKSLNSKSENVTVEGPNKNRVINISGLKDDVLLKQAEIKSSLETLEIKIKTETKVIPPKYHQFIDAPRLLRDFETVVVLPTSEDDATVSFVGLPANTEKAIKFAREASAKVALDSLDISRAHGNNVAHARYVAAYLEHAGVLAKISADNEIKITVPSYSKLADSSLTAVPVEFIGTKETADKIKQGRSAIIAEVNKISPTRVIVISDINRLFKSKVADAVKSAAKSENVYVIPFISLTSTSNDIVLISLDKEDDEFTPSQEEINARLAKVNDSLAHIRELQEDIKTVVLSIPADKQQFIEGPNGTTLKALLADRAQVSVKLHTGESGEVDEDKVYLEGSKADVAHIEKEIESLLKDAENLKDIYSFESTIQVPTVTLSRLIGKNGSKLTQLREQFSVDIDVEKNAAGEKAAVKITGYKFNVKEAEQFIQTASKRFADEVTKTVLVPAKYRSAIIGANGQYVKRLQTKYNVSINFQDKTDDVIIRGPSRGVAKTEEEIKELVDYEIENGYSKEIQVPSKAISRVIGKAGETINRIAVDTGIEIKVKDSDDAEIRTVILTGSRKGLTDAEKQITAIVKEIEDAITVELEVNSKFFKDILGPRGSVKQAIIEKAGGAEEREYRRLLQIPEQGSDSNKIVSSGPKKIVDAIVAQIKAIVAEKEAAVTEKVTVAKDKHRLLIGQAGSVRRALEDEFNIRLSIPNITDKSESVSLTGKPEDIAKAIEKVTELTADQWKEIVEVPVYLHAAVSERGAFPRKLRNEYDVQVEHGELSSKAIKLSSAFPAVPKEAFGDAETESVKFTISEESVEAPADEKTIPWKLIGTDENVARVSNLIKDLLVKFAKDDSTAFFWVKDASVFGKIVGPQGSRLNNIRNKSGAQIYVPRNSDKVNNVIFLKGTKTALEKADKLIQAEISKK
ncbi:hypothetical protein WICPIJ_008019 [Wickerhamomyces pijperi]|uniref:K Homology domain-containing protein n=1 Tax=Wickerhamomyces pijperi TaxID=599730 RepID=A0A9P8PZ54_WICPI|nr:hypothetical protein WICPIJ_008019 [Wickerhamomyces pijperi]